MPIWDNIFGIRTPKEEELLGFVDSLSKADGVREAMKQYIVGADVAILANGEEAQPFADVVSLSVYSTTGKGAYRTTIKIRGPPSITGVRRRELEQELTGKRLIVVDASYNDVNIELFEREFTRNGYKIAGLMYFAPFPRPYAREIKLVAKQDRPITEKA